MVKRATCFYCFVTTDLAKNPPQQQFSTQHTASPSPWHLVLSSRALYDKASRALAMHEQSCINWVTAEPGCTARPIPGTDGPLVGRRNFNVSQSCGDLKWVVHEIRSHGFRTASAHGIKTVAIFTLLHVQGETGKKLEFGALFLTQASSWEGSFRKE